jgi:hypothetical protein
VLLQVQVQVLRLIRVVENLLHLLVIVVVVVEFRPIVNFGLGIERFLEELSFSLLDIAVKLFVDCLELLFHLRKILIGSFSGMFELLD